MRKIISLMMLAAVGAFIFTGCTDKCEDPAAINFDEKGECIFNNLPTITAFAITGDALPGAVLTIDFVAGDNEGLKSWKLETEKGGTVTEDHNEDLTGSNQTIQHDYTIPTTMQPGDLLVITVTVTDNNDETTSQSQTLTINAPLTEHTGQFYHIQGSLKGAYDLVNDTEKAAGDPDADKDMKNTDAAGAGFTGSWTTGSTTTWVKDNDYDYDNATSTSAEAAFNAGTAGTDATNPANGDIYIGNLRGAGNFVIVRIDNMDANDATCGCNNIGKSSFSYKK